MTPTDLARSIAIKSRVARHLYLWRYQVKGRKAQDRLSSKIAGLSKQISVMQGKLDRLRGEE
jgi:TolA-binding protein